MSLKLALLNNVKHRLTKIVAQCPACAEVGADKTGNHLVMYPDGKFGCTAHPKDKVHRRWIAELVGDPDRQVKPWTLKLHGNVVLSGGQHPPATAISINSLSRSSVTSLKKSAGTPSETSATAFSDNTDGLEHSTHCTGVELHPVRIGGSATPSETSENILTITPSEASEDIITKALTLFDGNVAAVIPPDAIVPGRFRDVLATWTPTRNHPGLQGYTPRRLRGWTKRGSPVYYQ
jgi:hypothetical protein